MLQPYIPLSSLYSTRPINAQIKYRTGVLGLPWVVRPERQRWRRQPR